MRLLDRKDASLAIALVTGAFVIFQKPLHLLVDVAHSVELRYNIDLLSGLVVLAGAFVFHAFTKRQQAKAASDRAVAEVMRERLRSAELERLVAFGSALGSALDTHALRQVFCRFFPAFARERQLWALTRTKRGWDNFLPDATTALPRGLEALGSIATEALSTPTN